MANKQTAAWLLDLGGYRVVASEWEMLHLLSATECQDQSEFGLPMPGYCGKAVVWQEQRLPVINLKLWLEADQSSQLPQDKPICHFPFVGIVALGVAQTQTGAFFLASKPQRIVIAEDSRLAALPEPIVLWQQLAISCVEYGGNALPILDFPVIFTDIFHTI